ncbi:MAG: hypothetical protein A2Y33_16255 [Spirochaetes bacterium GWF1_51_8]|nr:MAG: hypothetical protein A2Y33_16255 [Spirochaetes bacterium GWF1_51_8]
MQKVVFGQSCLDGAGLGVFAVADIPQGEVLEIAPVIVIPNNREKEILDILPSPIDRYPYEWETSSRNAPGRMIMSYAIVLGYGSLYNHSLEPNAMHERDLRKKTMIYKALRNIAKGEEIFIDYCTDDHRCLKFTGEGEFCWYEKD